MNKKLVIDINTQVLLKEDIITIIKYLIELINSKARLMLILTTTFHRRVRTVVSNFHSSLVKKYVWREPFSESA
jgi:hypothetical protein